MLKELNQARDQARDFLEENNIKPSIWSQFASLGDFFRNIPAVCKLIIQEPEILVFVFIQWLVICLAYLAWIQMLHWIPDSVWDAIDSADKNNRNESFNLINSVFLGWSLLIVCAASYPISLCNAAIVVAHNLRACGEKSTFYRCIAIASLYTGRIWLFSTVDAWITLSAILRRLPGKKGIEISLFAELIYYAWKVGTIAVVPALLNGKDFVSAGEDSIKLLKNQPFRVLGLRLGYSGICWIIGILSYVFAIYAIYFHLYIEGLSGPHMVYKIYFIVIVPIFFAVGIISVLVRPFYLLSVAKLYTDNVEIKVETEGTLNYVPKFINVLFSWKTILFFFLLAQILLAVFFGDRIGWVNWIHHLAQQDLSSSPR